MGGQEQWKIVKPLALKNGCGRLHKVIVYEKIQL